MRLMHWHGMKGELSSLLVWVDYLSSLQVRGSDDSLIRHTLPCLQAILLLDVGILEVASIDAPVRDLLKICIPLHSMTSSARSRIAGGTVMPRVSAVFKFSTNSNLVGRSTGVSAGLAP
jgi:hypothetical protein